MPRIRARPMFGGVGLYSGELFFALIADDTVYFKADESTRPDFEARGMGPYRPFGDAGGTMQYYQVPEDLLEDPEALRPWAEKAVATVGAIATILYQLVAAVQHTPSACS